MLDREFVRQQIAKLAARTGILHADRADWLIELIIDGDGSGVPAGRNALKDPRLAETLTELGASDPKWAVASITACASFARNREQDRAETLKLDRPTRLSAVSDGRTCSAAKAMFEAREVFPPGEEPELPLPDCDAWNCRCIFVGHWVRPVSP